MKAQALFQIEKPAIDPGVMWVREPSGTYRAAAPREVIKAATAALGQVAKRGQSFTDPADSRQYLSIRLGAREQEVFAVIFLDSKHRLIEYEELFFGTINSASVHPREVVKRALHHNAATAIVAHNHPSGNPEPSRADEVITSRLKDALALVDVRLLDHIVVAADQTTSLAERGAL
jgi:DNA repair protein RadC